MPLATVREQAETVTPRGAVKEREREMSAPSSPFSVEVTVTVKTPPSSAG